MNFQKFINFLPIIAIVALTWYGLQPKTSRETLLSVPGNQSAAIQIPNGEPDPDPTASLSEYEVVANSVYDGDTLRVRSSDGQVLKVRFACVDAPELKQPLGQESRNYLRSIINEAGGKVKVQIVDTDQYGRSVAELWTKSGLLQSRMVATGMAFAYDQYAKNCPNWEAVKSAEKTAIEYKLGVWRSHNFQRPWDWRKANR
ncbi:thermonuclease family protein [Microcoleus sp. AR_TQ3_B6]|uniref:thermonuclease family protein n=1 Tax=Microcoleus sp. AR_TQ3_B6 TaxID=3055284 RepID=UPI002FD68D91